MMNLKQPQVKRLTGTLSDAVSSREELGRACAYTAAAESIVLLKNENDILPLPQGATVALYGAGAVFTVKGGTGSGDVNERSSVSLRQGMETAGFQLTSRKWLDAYQQTYTAARQAWKEWVLEQSGIKGSEYTDLFFDTYAANPFQPPEGDAIDKADADETDTAVVVICRNAGENADRHLTQGDYLLTGKEREMLIQASEIFGKIILIVNAGGVVDLSVLDEIPAIQAVLVTSQLGMEGGAAIADVLRGQVNPSGKLSATWAKHYEDYPCAAQFSHLSGDVTKEEYSEGIYVGYRYFDTFGVKPRFCFGYGLSYTSFDVRGTGTALSETAPGVWQVTVSAKVTNIGKCSGKEVVQVYVSCPQGTLNKEWKRLCAFGKTKMLRPGASETLTLSFPVEQMASFCEECSAYVLEAGSYAVIVGTSVETVHAVASIQLNQLVKLRTVANLLPRQRALDEIQPDKALLAQRTAKRDSVLAGLKQLTLSADQIAVETVDYTPSAAPSAGTAVVAEMTTEQCIDLVIGSVSQSQNSALGSAGQNVPGAAGETETIHFADGTVLPGRVLADGPAGLRLMKNYEATPAGHIYPKGFLASIEGGLFDSSQPHPDAQTYYQYCTAVPVGTALAQSWNLPLLEEVGKMVAGEMEEFNVTLWLAPGMTLQRNPLCGRNFEYYSEDPYLSGMLAAAITEGVQSHPGRGTTIKHFACNNQEDNRKGSDSIVSQRALRELYLHSFEIAVKKAQPMSIMTSYNLINGVHAANNPDLCTGIARGEWGFHGMIMTDWTTTDPQGGSKASLCMAAGNDLVMPGTLEDKEDIRQALANGTLSETALRACAARIADMVLETE